MRYFLDWTVSCVDLVVIFIDVMTYSYYRPRWSTNYISYLDKRERSKNCNHPNLTEKRWSNFNGIANPHPPGTKAHREWEQGWEIAKAQEKVDAFGFTISNTSFREDENENDNC